jgi:hypothetical protein
MIGDLYITSLWISQRDAWTKENITKYTSFKPVLMEACVCSDVYVRGCPVRKISAGTPTTLTDVFVVFSLPPNKRWNKFLLYTTSAPSHALCNPLFILPNHSTLQSLSNDRVYKLRTNKQTHTHIAGNCDCSATTSCDTPVAHTSIQAHK